MSIKDYEGGIITKNPTTPTGPYQDGAASGVWTMDQAAEYTKQGVWPTAGNISPEQYVDGLLSTYLYTGTGSALDIDNDLDLSGKGGLVWIKNRTNVSDHALFDTARGAEKLLFTTSNAAEQDRTADNDSLGAFNADGFSLQASTGNRTNESGSDFVSWSFLKKPGFFDVVTFTGTGSNPHTVSHNLGSVPGFIVVKAVSSTGNWCVAAYDGTNYRQLSINSTAASAASASVSSIATSTTIDVGYMGVNFDGSANSSGVSYVAYLFASEDARFGDNANESIIKCGSYTGTGSSLDVSLGFEPQWIMVKRTDSTSPWTMWDIMRGLANNGTSDDRRIKADTADAESNSPFGHPTATGFTVTGTNTDYNASGGTYIYIAIRRPMITPTAATEVFTPIARTGTGATAEVTGVGFSPDMLLQARRTAPDWPTSDRLRGVDKNLGTPYTQAETTPGYIDSYDMDGVTLGSGNAVNGSGLTYIQYFFKRAPGFFDVVAYTGTGSQKNESHNLGVTPELMIVKSRSNAGKWSVYESGLGIGTSNGLALNQNSGTDFNNTTLWVQAPTSSVFTLGTNTDTNGSGYTYIAYLFATLAGISKVGSYTGTGSNVDVDCGFTSGARFILIKRAAGIGLTGDWYVYDSVRGIVSGNDPFLLINTTDTENTSTDYIDPLPSGFTVTSSAPTALNNSGDNYIFLAIA